MSFILYKNILVNIIMLYFQAKTKEELAKMHDNSFKDASKATKTTFYQSLKRIEKIYDKPLPELKLEFVNNPEEFMDTLNASKYSENTKLTTLTCILKLLKLIDVPLITYNQWLTLLKDKTEERQKRDDSNLKARLKVLLDYKDIKMMVYGDASKYYNGIEDFDDYRNFMILAFFTLQIPVRVSNYVGMKVVDDEAFIEDEGNYILVNDDEYKFVFNKYRTSHILGKKEMLIHDKTLRYLIDKWLSHYNKESNNFLIVAPENKRAMTGKQMEEAIRLSSEKIFKTPISIDNIRASYMRRISELDPDFQDKLDIANILGYSSTSVLDKHSVKEV